MKKIFLSLSAILLLLFPLSSMSMEKEKEKERNDWQEEAEAIRPQHNCDTEETEKPQEEAKPNWTPEVQMELSGPCLVMKRFNN